MVAAPLTKEEPVNQLPITIVGNLVGDPEIKFTKAGVAVARFTVAHNPRRFDRQTNEWAEGEPTFFECSAWRQLAENVAESLVRGTRIVLVGNIRTDRWESDGTGKTPAGEKMSRQIVDVLAIGPELAYATAAVKKTARTRAGETAPGDPWASASKERPAAGAGSFPDDEPPF
jgi:single-strand DNA-binding protein